MGFGFNLFVFPILLLISVGLILYFIFSKQKVALKILAIFWSLIVVAFIIAEIRVKFNRHIQLTKKDIVGDYRVDKSFYPGKNADWQYGHYRFTITPNDSLYFYVTNKDTILKTVKAKLKYPGKSPALWSIQGDSSHHVLISAPTLYRGRKRYYYVFHSGKFGNMFFRKQEDSNE